MSQKHFWAGVGVGAGAVIGGLWASGLFGKGGDSRIIRLEKSMQIGRPVHDVFGAWSQFERIPQYCRYITHVHSVGGNRSEWTANIEGRVFNWQAELTQFIPNQVIGWKSVDGTKHSGRVTFAPIGDDTLVHVQMNYEPPMQFTRPLFGAISGQIEGRIEAALRDFKAELEGINREVENLADDGEIRTTPANVRQFGPRGTRTASQPDEPVHGQASGTFGTSTFPNANPVYGAPEQSTIEVTRPPNDSYEKNK